MTRTRFRPESSGRIPVRPRAAALVATTTVAALVGAPLVAAPAAAEPSPEKTTSRHAVVLVNFRNSSLSDPAQVRAKAVRQFFEGTDSASSYFAANSGNRLSLVPAQGDGVFGPFTIDVDGSTCDTRRMADLARKAMPAEVKYDRLSVVIPGTAACNWWGLGLVPGSTTWFQEGAVNQDDTTAVLHEYGHNLGFYHERRELCPVGQFTGCSDGGHSHTTPMGGGGGHKGLSSPELINMKWLAPDRIASPKASTSVHLKPLHAPASAGGTRVVDIPLNSEGERLVVEYRHNVANSLDTDIENPGLFVYRVDDGNYQAAISLRNNTEDNKKMVGSFTGSEPMTDLANHISLRYDKMTADGVDLHIDLAHTGAQPAPDKASAGTSNSPAAGASAGTSNSPAAGASASTSKSPSASASTSKSPSASASRTAPTATQIGDTAKDLGVTKSSTANLVPAASSSSKGRELAATGADIMLPTLIGTTLVGAGAALLLRRRRNVRHRRH